MNLNVLPVVEARAAQRLVIRAKPELAYEVKRRKGSPAESGDVAGVRRYFGLDQRDVQTRVLHSVGCRP